MPPAIPGPRPGLSRPRIVGAMILTAGALVARELVKPRPNETARLLDWGKVRHRAFKGTGEAGPTHIALDGEELGARYDAMLAEMQPYMAEALGQGLPLKPFPRFVVLDRHAWIEVNLEMFQNLLDPVLKIQEALPASLLTDIGRAGISEYMGALLGFLSRRVLGQYDPVLMAAEGAAAPSALYLVEPNIEAWEARSSVPSDPVRRWLVLHEATHAWEFEAHPWLREHMNSLIRDLIAHRLFTSEQPGRLDVIRALTIGARSQWQAMSQIQAVMSLLEGFSNVMMRRVGQAHLEHFDEVDAEFNRRSANRTAAERAFFKITGLDLKMQQYVQGEAFCDAVMAEGGMERLSRVWTSPQTLPTLDEIRNPRRWLERVT
ncbi:MAG TPA: zinc-dependent metalloprotease [Candidatus Dormibacteraeota bacterium]|nr:zinc-dependent metalloprotease [Candidatus Dormibacteraeota bacterium]